MEVLVTKRPVKKDRKTADELEQLARAAALNAGYHSLREFQLCSYYALIGTVNETEPAPKKKAIK